MTKRKRGWKFRHGGYSYRVVWIEQNGYMMSPWLETRRRNTYAVIKFGIDTDPDFAMHFDFWVYAPQLPPGQGRVDDLATLPEALAAGAMLIERVQALPKRGLA